MTTTPTFWGNQVTFSNDPLAYGPRVKALNDGTFVITWENGEEIFGRYLSEMGSFIGGNFLTGVSSSGKPLGTPIVTQQNDGLVVVNYALEFSATPQDYNIYWYSPNASSWPTRSTGYNEILLDSTSRTGGGGAIVYNYTGPGNVTNMVLQFTTANGDPASNQIFIDSSTTRIEQNPALASLHTGFVAVAYESILNSGNFPREIRMHVFTPGEADVSGDVTVSATNVSASFPDIIELRDGSFVVTWQQDGGIAFRRYFANGIALDANPVVIPDTDGAFIPKITALKDGGFIIAWTDANGTETDGTLDLDLFLQRYDSSGNEVGSTVHIDKPGDQGLFDMNIDTLADGRVIMTFVSETGDSTNLTRLDYQIFDPRENVIIGTLGEDNIVGRQEASTIKGLAGNDKITGVDGDDKLFGGGDDDHLIGGRGADKLRGGSGDDILDGQQGKDVLRGDLGADTLTGGSRSDVFLFAAVSDSSVLITGRDTIMDFSQRQHDVIDLHLIDADSTSGKNQDFSFIGQKGFHQQAGELRYGFSSGDTVVKGDVDGDGKADFAILIKGHIVLTAADFLL